MQETLFVISLNRQAQKTHLCLVWYYNCEWYYAIKLHAFAIEENTLK